LCYCFLRFHDLFFAFWRLVRWLPGAFMAMPERCHKMVHLIIMVL